MANYSKQIATARRMIAAKGQSMVFVQVTDTKERDTDTGSYKAIKTLFPCKGVKTSPKTREVTAGFYSTENLIVLVAGDAIPKPSITDIMQFDGHDWNIKSIMPVSPAEQVILYKFVLQDMGKIEDV